MKLIVFGCAAIPLLFATQTHAAEEKCELQRYAELPVTMSGTRPLIAGTINGAPARFLADSGAFFSVLSRAAADRYELKLGPAPGNMRLQGTGGGTSVHVTKVKEFSLVGFSGGRTFQNVDFLVTGSAGGDDIAGIIGQNVLGGGNTEYDLANGVIRAFRAKNCRGQSLAYWARDQSVAELEIETTNPRSPHLIGEARLNGKKIRVLFDTGAWRSLLTLDAAERAGVEPEDEGVVAAGISRGFGKKTTENSIARFESLDIGGEVIKNARLRIGDAEIRIADMMLGADFFLSHRVYVASAQNKIYFTYNGGPVFDLRTSPNDAKTPAGDPNTATSTATSTATASASAADGSPALTSAELRRRGAASAGRRDFAAAIADFDRAIELDANDAENFYQRGLARLANRQPALAMADFDATLKLKPDHLEGLLSRGALRVRRSAERAAVDFQEALRLAPADPGVAFRIAEAYQSAGDFATAIERLDAWIAAYPKDERLPTALSARCWSRAMLGKELELARADCDAALKKGPRNSVVFDSRGLVWLRLGNFDEAIDDYTAALKLQPKKASSLYGLGIAETRKGLTSSGADKIQAAIELDPQIATLYRRIGLAP